MARKVLRTRGKPRPSTSLLGKDLKIPPIYYRALLSEDYTNRYQVEPHRADRRAILKGSGSPAPPIGPMSRSPSRKRRSSTLKSIFDAYFVFKATSLDHSAPNKNSLDHFRSK